MLRTPISLILVILAFISLNVVDAAWGFYWGSPYRGWGGGGFGGWGGGYGGWGGGYGGGGSWSNSDGW
uniref:Uncharacterized protein n=1 Tax=Pristionchus pacificus TaxID=54126 RepID=A0A2A6C2K1_PRIPA|eukprot:PDM72317.1 hypothetical protein PRIPAC_38751 [Pristionchus pacificus]